MFSDSLIENLPKVVFGSEESVVITNARQLLVLIYYSGPKLVADHFLRSMVRGYIQMTCNISFFTYLFLLIS